MIIFSKGLRREGSFCIEDLSPLIFDAGTRREGKGQKDTPLGNFLFCKVLPEAHIP